MSVDVGFGGVAIKTWMVEKSMEFAKTIAPGGS
jgi:hypothetical protein